MENEQISERGTIATIIFTIFIVILAIVLIIEYYYLYQMSVPSPGNYDKIKSVTNIVALMYVIVCFSAYFVSSQYKTPKKRNVFAIFPSILSCILFLIFTVYKEIFYSFQVDTGYYILGVSPVFNGLIFCIVGLPFNLIVGLTIIKQYRTIDHSERSPPAESE